MSEVFNNEKLNNECEVERGDGYEILYFPQKGVTVCKLFDCESDAANRILKYMDKVRTFTPSFIILKYMIKDVYIGVAKCSPEDTYDKAFGRKLALTKAKAKRGRAINASIKRFIKDFNNQLKALTTYGIHEVPDVAALIDTLEEKK